MALREYVYELSTLLLFPYMICYTLCERRIKGYSDMKEGSICPACQNWELKKLFFGDIESEYIGCPECGFSLQIRF